MTELRQNVIDASNVARKRISYLAYDELGGRRSEKGTLLGVPTWCQLHGIDRKPFQRHDTSLSFETLLKTAEIFDCSIDYLLGRTDVKEVNR